MFIWDRLDFTIPNFIASPQLVKFTTFYILHIYRQIFELFLYSKYIYLIPKFYHEVKNASVKQLKIILSFFFLTMFLYSLRIILDFRIDQGVFSDYDTLEGSKFLTP